ncbi:MAG: thymidine phosphorylase [Kiritimatiellae bacterium]|nr:thymidine phosphorylase [Kiritimatiellia bacterium]
MIVPQWVIEKKRDGQTLSGDEIRGFIEGFTRGEIADYQAAAFAMAVYFVGMTADETAALTDAMLRSGDVLDLSAVPGPKVDKHSTGGIGDKVSLVLAPLLAACGARVPMMSGRGLGITGGTLDKLEAIPGFQTRLNEEQAVAVLADVGCVMIGPTARVAPADRKLYALRDVTGTVPSVPLITASILSKKLAEGVEHLVLDVKCGQGAFMRDLVRARDLAAMLVATARRMGLSCRALITDMNQPLGRAVGNALEVREAIELLRGGGPPDVAALTVELGAELLEMARLARSLEEARGRLRAALADGSALERFTRMIRAQGGDAAVVEHPERLPSAPVRLPLVSPTTAWVAGVDAERVGRACVLLGAGRRRTEDAVDPRVGVADLAKIGARVCKGEVLGVIHAADDAGAEEARRLLAGAFTFVDEPPAPPPLVLERRA